MYPLIVSEKWIRKPATLKVPGLGVIARPSVTREMQVRDLRLYNWLIEQGYCLHHPDDPRNKKEVRTIIEADGSLDVKVPKDASLTDRESLLLEYFKENSIETIAEQVKGITLAMARSLKEFPVLGWEEVVVTLSDRALKSALNWIETQ
jgi:hypothetical protein